MCLRYLMTQVIEESITISRKFEGDFSKSHDNKRMGIDRIIIIIIFLSNFLLIR